MRKWLLAASAPVFFVLLAQSPRPSVKTADELAKYRNLGKAFYENPTTQAEAVTALRKAFDLAPNSAREQLNYGLALLRAGKTDEAVKQIQAVQDRDPSIPHTWFNLGIVLKKQGENDRALAQFERMVKLAPDEPISRYNYAAMLKAVGRQADAIREFEKTIELDANLAAPHFQLFNLYRSSSKPAEAKRELDFFQRLKKQQEGAAIPEDVDWSMYAEVYDVMEDRGPAPPKAKLMFEARPGRDLGPQEQLGDFDNDNAPDRCSTENILAAGKPGQKIPSLPKLAGGYALCLWIDYDHDYDHDLLLLGKAPALLRNEGAAFSERTSSIPFSAGTVSGAAAFRVVADTKGTDLVVSYSDKHAVLYRDMLQGVYKPEPLSLPAGAQSLVPGDLDNDGFIDLAFTDGSSVSVSWNDQGKLQPPAKLAPGKGSLALADLENRGVLDVVLAGSVVRNLGSRKFTAPEPFSATERCEQYLVAGDFNADGRIDLRCGANRLINRTPITAAHVGVQLEGVKNLKLAYGSEVEVKAGPRYQKAIYNGSPLIFGLGMESAIDTIRITWANGLIQNEIRPIAKKTHVYKEAQRLSGSCPMIWTWNGKEFEYITDVLGVAPLGASAGDGEYFPVDHDEFIQIPGNALKPVDGQYEIRITEELSEVAYLDEIQLLAVDHPANTAIYTNDKFKSPPFPEFRLFGVTNRIHPIRATDHKSRNVLARVAAKDQVYPDSFRRDLSGGAELHYLDLDFPQTAAQDGQAVLILNGWVDWADGSTFLNAAQQRKNGAFVMPHLQVKDDTGRWVTVIEDMGMPAGKPKTIAVDLSGKFLSKSRSIRIVTSLCVYWDEIFLSERTSTPEHKLRTTAITSADLRFRGFSPIVIHPERRQPEQFRYDNPSPASMWNPTPGNYTRYGPVVPLLTSVNDQMVIMGSGDELRLRFDATGLPSLPSGWTRDFLLKVDGWAKDRDPNTAHSQTTEPLPFHKMSRFPYPPPEKFPSTPELEEWKRTYNTRPALRLMRPLAKTFTRN